MVPFYIVIEKWILTRHHIRRRRPLTDHLILESKTEAELVLKTINFADVRSLSSNNNYKESIIHLGVL